METVSIHTDDLKVGDIIDAYYMGGRIECTTWAWGMYTDDHDQRRLFVQWYGFFEKDSYAQPINFQPEYVRIVC